MSKIRIKIGFGVQQTPVQNVDRNTKISSGDTTCKPTTSPLGIHLRTNAKHAHKINVNESHKNVPRRQDLPPAHLPPPSCKVTSLKIEKVLQEPYR
jgi:hypothetical protein